MTGLANEGHDGPMFLSLLQVLHFQIRGLVPSQSASQEKGQQGTVTFALYSCIIRTLPQRARLFSRQPVSHAHALLLQALRTPNPTSQIGAEQTASCGLVGQPPNRAQPEVDGPGSQPSGFQVTAVTK